MTVKTVAAALLIGIPVLVGAQAARPANSAPEVLTATAQAKNASGAISGRLEVRITRYTPEFDRKAVEEALRLGGYPQFLTTLRNSPQVGHLTLGDSQKFAIRYARETVESGGRTILVVTDKPVYFVGGGRSSPKARAGYEVAMVRIQLDAAGQGKGTMAGAARVRPDGQGGVLLDDHADEPITLTAIMRKPG